MSENDVVVLMRSSRSEVEWNANCDKVKREFGGGYPSWWFSAIMLSGLYEETSQGWD